LVWYLCIYIYICHGYLAIYSASASAANSAHIRQPRPDSGLGFRVFLGGGAHHKKMAKGHLPRVVYRQVQGLLEIKDTHRPRTLR